MNILTLNVEGLNREQIRSKILRTWEAESSGSGKYRYDVEQCSDGSKIYLIRPANLNKGCDFVIVSENYLKWKNGNDKPPKHKDVFNSITHLFCEDKSLKDGFSGAVERIYACENIDKVLSDHPILLSTLKCEAERVLKLLKWMWIEQDITYWTGKGRQMLKKHVDELLQSLQ